MLLGGSLLNKSLRRLRTPKYFLKWKPGKIQGFLSNSFLISKHFFMRAMCFEAEKNRILEECG